MKKELRFRVDSSTTTEESDFEELNNEIFHKLELQKFQSGTFFPAKETLEGQFSIDTFPKKECEKYFIGHDNFVDLVDNHKNLELSTIS